MRRGTDSAVFLTESPLVTVLLFFSFHPLPRHLFAFKELAPSNADWFFVRAASLARHIYLRPGAGVGALRCVYGGRKNRGVLTGRHAEASGNVIRKALQALEKLKLVAVDPNGGRRITVDGQRDLDHVAQLVAKSA